MIRKILLALSVAFLATPAMAADGTAGVAVSTGTIANNVLTRNWVDTEWIETCGYYACGDNGGGLLHQELGLAADNCVIFADSAGHTYRRAAVRGLGEECGLTVGSIYDAALNGEAAQGAVARITAAQTAFPTVGIDTLQLNINTMWKQNFTFADQFLIDCGAQVGFVSPTADYRLQTLKGIIAHPPSVTITYPDNGKSPGFRHCIFERSGDGYAPTTFVPNGTRDSINLANAFAGDGLSIHAEAPVLDNVMILGFDRCFDISKATKGAKRMQFHDVSGDCGSHTGYPAFSIKDIPSGGYFDNLRTNSFLAKTNNNEGSSTTYDLDKILDDGGGQCKAVVSVASGAYTYVAGDTVWIGMGNNHGAQSCQGPWTIGAVTNVALTVDGCQNASGCQEFPLNGSQFTSTVTTGTWASGSNAVTLAISPSQLATGQTITDGAVCIPANTYVGDVIAETTGAAPWNQIFLVQADKTTPQATACAGVAAAVTIANTAFAKVAGCPDNCATYALESAIWRKGDGIYMENDAGVTINRCQSYNHQNAVHLYGNSATGNTQLGTIEACSVGTADPIPDDSTCGLYVEGDHNGHDASDYSILGGIWAQHLAGAFCVNSDSDNALKIIAPTVGPSGGKRYGAMLKIVRGNVIFQAPQAHGKGNIWVAAGATLNMNGAYLPQGQLYGQDGTAVINGCGNSLQYEELNGKLYTARECVGVLNAGFMPSYTTTGTLQTGQHTVYGTVALFAGAATINLSGQAVFANANYTCSLTDLTGLNPTKLTKTSAIQFVITGTGTDNIDYRCTGI